VGSSPRLLVWNPSKTDVLIKRGSRLAQLASESLKERRARLDVPLPEADNLPNNPDLPIEDHVAWIREEFEASINDSGCAARGPEKKIALDLLISFQDLFSKDGEFGRTTLVKHAIHTGDAAPIKCRNRPVNPALLDDLRHQMEEWLRYGVVEPSSSPWASALVAVKKKNGKTRWCVDYRALNDITTKDAYPMPLIEDNLAHLAHSTVFSTVDGSGAFHVVELEEDAKPKTAFATPWGLYQFKRMPFGLTNAPATYSRLMQVALRKIPCSKALSYLDDTLIHSNGFSDHVVALRQVLEAHRAAGLKLQPSKCHLFRTNVEYLGHAVSANGVKPMTSYLDVVRDWPVPQTLTELRAFLGKVGYYRRFIKDYGKIARPLTESTKEENLADPKLKTIKITTEFKAAHRQLKEALCRAPILAFPRFDTDEPFIVDTDWSQEHRAIGGVLSQKQDGVERVICYGAKKLNTGQANYPATKGELFAIIFFLRYWRYYLHWRKFLLRTDHQALTWIKTMEAPTGMVARWLDTLANFDFEVQYRKGDHHGNADGLSRAPHVTETLEGEPNLMVEERLQAILPPETIGALPSTNEEWAKEQDQDRDLRSVRKWLGKPPGSIGLDRRSLSVRARYLYDLLPRLSVNSSNVIQLEPLITKGVFNRPPLPVIPQHLEGEAISLAHHLVAHRGIHATAHLLATRAFLVSGRAAIERSLAACIPCQVKKGEPKPQRHTYATVKSGFPFQRISMDFVGPMPRTKRGNTMILTIKDTFTKWVEAFPMARATAENVAKILEREIFPRYGYPDYIHSDRGSQFTGHLMSELAQLVHISITVTPAYHPQSNPVERAHRDLKAGLRAALESVGGLQWDECIPQILFAFRITPARGTGYSPFLMMFGRDPNIPLGVVSQPPGALSANQYVDQLWSRMERVHGWARENLAKEVARQQKIYTQPQIRYKPGDKVWLFNPALSTQTGRKLVRPWTGPWIVSQEISPVLYEIRDREGRTIPAAADRLRPYVAPTAQHRDCSPSRLVQLPSEDIDGSWLSLPPVLAEEGTPEEPPDSDDAEPINVAPQGSDFLPDVGTSRLDENNGLSTSGHSHCHNREDLDGSLEARPATREPSLPRGRSPCPGETNGTTRILQRDAAPTTSHEQEVNLARKKFPAVPAAELGGQKEAASPSSAPSRGLGDQTAAATAADPVDPSTRATNRMDPFSPSSKVQRPDGVHHRYFLRKYRSRHEADRRGNPEKAPADGRGEGKSRQKDKNAGQAGGAGSTKRSRGRPRKRLVVARQSPLLGSERQLHSVRGRQEDAGKMVAHEESITEPNDSVEETYWNKHLKGAETLSI